MHPRFSKDITIKNRFYQPLIDIITKILKSLINLSLKFIFKYAWNVSFDKPIIINCKIFNTNINNKRYENKKYKL